MVVLVPVSSTLPARALPLDDRDDLNNLLFMRNEVAANCRRASGETLDSLAGTGGGTCRVLSVDEEPDAEIEGCC